MITRPMSSMSAGIQLRDILPSAKTVGPSNVVVHSACGQWNECQTDDVFVAVVDTECDGHDYAPQAVERGASAVVGERLMAIGKPQFIVPDSRTAYGQICHALAGNPSQRMATVGVAGTDGKTVTSHLIHNIFQAARLNAGLSTSIASSYGRRPESAQPADRSPIVAEQLSKMALGDCSHAVLEASSIALAQHALSGVALDTAVVTNIRRGNIEYHGSVDNYHCAITRLIDYLKSTGFAIINADDRESVKILDEIFVPTLTFGIHQAAEVTARLIDRNQSWQTFMLSAGMESIPVRTPIIGKQHIYNCLAAASVGLTFGIELEVIARGLETAVIPGRLERVDCGQSFGVWVDSALAPTQLSGAIAAISRVCEGKLWCVCSTDDSQSQQDRCRIGEIVERKTEKPIITQSRINPLSDFESCHQVLDGFDQPGKARVMPDRFKAIEWVLSQAKANDCVLIAGCGEKTVALAGQENWAITDRDICQAWFYEHNGSKLGSNEEIFNIEDYR